MMRRTQALLSIPTKILPRNTTCTLTHSKFTQHHCNRVLGGQSHSTTRYNTHAHSHQNSSSSSWGTDLDEFREILERNANDIEDEKQMNEINNSHTSSPENSSYADKDSIESFEDTLERVLKMQRLGQETEPTEECPVNEMRSLLLKKVDVPTKSPDDIVVTSEDIENLY